jgi:hypothetical protein
MSEERQQGFGPYTPPFRYDDAGQYIWDSERKMLAEMRGWGMLKGKMCLSDEDAEKAQDRLGHKLVDALNLMWQMEAGKKEVFLICAYRTEDPKTGHQPPPYSLASSWAMATDTAEDDELKGRIRPGWSIQKFTLQN